MLDLDFRQLAIFEAVYRKQNVSAAAEHLGIAQATVSVGLAKLRQRFNDPLFVRTAKGMQPTPRADQLIEPLTSAYQLVNQTIQNQAKFEAAKSNRVFRLCTTDVGQVVFLPPLVNFAQQNAPQIRIEVSNTSSALARQLESNEIDLAVGFLPQLEAGFFEQTLFEESYVCVVRTNHPRIKKHLSVKQFGDEQHVEVTPAGNAQGVVEKALQKHQLSTTQAIRLPSYVGLATLLTQSNLIATVPSRFAHTLAQAGNIKILKPPLALPGYAVKQYWHMRYHKDAGNQWLRAAMVKLFQKRPASL
jgi:DNA-binding transcriptional LysR family regulator